MAPTDDEVGELREALLDALLGDLGEFAACGVVPLPALADTAARLGITQRELRLASALARRTAERDAAEAQQADLTRALNATVDGGEWAAEKVRRQQSGNQARKVAADGWEEEAAARHRAGEKWVAIAPDYGLGERRCRELVAKAGCKTRGKR